MERRKLMKKIFISILFVLFTLAVNISTFAMTDQEADIYNNLYYPQSVYNGGIYLTPQQESQEAYVNTATGSTHLKVTDLTLPGRNGFDLKITRIYNSLNSALFESYLKQIPIEKDVTYYMITGIKRIDRTYTNSTETSEEIEDVCLTPDFVGYLEEEDERWMVQNASKYEYTYTIDPAKSKLFDSRDDAEAVIEMLEATDPEIEVWMLYDNVAIYTANYYDFEVEEFTFIEYDYEYSDALREDTVSERYSPIGAGWEFTFPYIEIRQSYDDDYRFLHFGDKGTWQIDFGSDGGDNNLVGYSVNDIILKYNDSVYHDGLESRYCVTEKNGVQHFFAEDGRLLVQRDRYGNQIEFYCDTEEYENSLGEMQDFPYVTHIVDSMGRTVTITSEDVDYNKKYIVISVINPQDSSDKKTIKYILEAPARVGWSKNWILKRVNGRNDSVCIYDYEYEEGKFTFLNRNNTFYYDYCDVVNSNKGNSYITDSNRSEIEGLNNVYALLTSATTYGEKNYDFKYSSFLKNCTRTGSMEIYKAYNSNEGWLSVYDDRRGYINEKKYKYGTPKQGEYDGYIGYKSDDFIDASYKYKVEVTEICDDSEYTSTDTYEHTYVGAAYDKTILLTKHTDEGTHHKVITDYTYNQDTKLITNITSNNYSKSNSSQYITQSTAYTYDTENYGDVLTETANGESDRAVTYTYDNTYHFPITKTYKQDANTTILEEYVPTTDGKNIEYINTYENGTLKNKVQYSHDSYGNIINQKSYINDTDYIEKTFTYEDGAYVVNENVKQVSNNDGVTKDISISADYDYWGNQISKTDANGDITSFEYDKANRVTKATNPDSSIKIYDYIPTSSNIEVYETDENGNEFEVRYNANGDVKYIKYETLSVLKEHSYYNSFWGLEDKVEYTGEEDEEGYVVIKRRTHYTYDTAHRPISKTVYDVNDNITYQETYSYEITPDYIKQTTTVLGGDGNPSVVTSVYTDKYGNKIKTENGTDIETYTYDYMGNLLTVKSPVANAEGTSDVRTIEYDHMGNVISETDELGNVVTAEYDRLGRMTKTTDQNGNATEYVYDNLGRVIEQKTPFEEKDGTVYYSVKKMWYDNNGNVVKERVKTNAPGSAETYNEVKYTYDNRNRLVMTETSDGEKSNYTQNYYDAVGNLLRVYTGLSSPLTINGLDDVTGNDTDYAVTKYTYDAVNRLLSAEDALGKTETNVYETATGLLLSSTDRNGNTFTYTYDALGNLLSKSLADGTNAETTTYGSTGKVLSRENGTTTISYTYNSKGQLVTETDSETDTVKTYTYDPNGNRLTFTLTRNGTVEMSQSYSYDKLNRLTSVSENGTVIATYSYDNKGNRTQTVANGITTQYAYNLANLLTSQTTGDKLSETYTYYLNGNQKTKTSNGVTTTYEYDGMNRLTKENDTEYSFDDFGNRIEMTDGDNTTTYIYDKNNRLTESTEESGDTTRITNYFYDPNGNQISKMVMTNAPKDESATGRIYLSAITDENVAFYDYNCYNQLIGADTKGVKSTYTYSPDGLRHSKTVGSKTTAFVYDNASVIEEITEDGTNKYYRGIGIIKNDDGITYIYNGQGDAAILVNADGTTVASYTFDAYGNQTEENTIYNPFGYRGEYQDLCSGLIYLRNRYYDPSIGRFITEDPARDGLNWYVYCANNPVMFVDSFGLEKVAVRDYVEQYNGYVAWYDAVDSAYFRLNGNDLWTTISGKNVAGIKMSIINNAFYAEDSDLNNFFFGITTADIEAGVKITMFDGKPYIDITTPVTNALKRDAGDFIANKGDNDYFASRVGNEGDWNVKYREADGKHWEETLGISFWGYQTQMLLNEKLVTVEQVGNITYGYLGAAAGMSQIWMNVGSAGNHFLKHGIFGWGNEFADQSLFGLGINWYKTGVME